MNPTNSFPSQFLKELRLLRPAWAVALICICLPMAGINGTMQRLLVTVGLMLLGVRAFGAEFSQGTFALYLSQPLGRNRLWLLKVSALTLSMFSVVLMGWLLSKTGQSGFNGELFSLAVVALAAAGSGLFFSVLFRHATIALWMTLITPLASSLLLMWVVSWFAPEAAEQWISTFLEPILIGYGLLCGVGGWLLFRSARRGLF